MDTMCWSTPRLARRAKDEARHVAGSPPDEGLEETQMSHGVRSRSVRRAEDLGGGARLLVVNLGSDTTLTWMMIVANHGDNPG